MSFAQSNGCLLLQRRALAFNLEARTPAAALRFLRKVSSSLSVSHRDGAQRPCSRARTRRVQKPPQLESQDVQNRIFHQSFLPQTASGSVHAYVWKYSEVDGGRRPRHFHVEPELNVVVRGWAEFGAGESVVRVSQGELIGFPAGQDHVLLSASNDVFFFAVGMAPTLAAKVLGQSGPGHQLAGTVPLHLRPSASEFAALTRRSELILEQAGIEQHCAELWEHVHWLGRDLPRCSDGALHALTHRALRVVSESPEIHLEAIARSARTNASEVSRYFHRDLGMTFVRYRARLRLLRFIELEKGHAGNWLASAMAAGFGSYSQFHRSFAAELGCSPREFFHSGVRQQMDRAYDDERVEGVSCRAT
jgi:AraC-like DNA-binding protein/quercetin dioxygenase-like cupin family protein